MAPVVVAHGVVTPVMAVMAHHVLAFASAGALDAVVLAGMGAGRIILSDGGASHQGERGGGEQHSLHH